MNKTITVVPQDANPAAVSLEHRPKERALIAEEATCLLGVLEGSLTLGLVERLGAVVLVGGERWEGE